MANGRANEPDPEGSLKGRITVKLQPKLSKHPNCIVIPLSFTFLFPYVTRSPSLYLDWEWNKQAQKKKQTRSSILLIEECP